VGPAAAGFTHASSIRHATIPGRHWRPSPAQSGWLHVHRSLAPHVAWTWHRFWLHAAVHSHCVNESQGACDAELRVTLQTRALSFTTYACRTCIRRQRTGCRKRTCPGPCMWRWRGTGDRIWAGMCRSPAGSPRDTSTGSVGMSWVASRSRWSGRSLYGGSNTPSVQSRPSHL
jgi:hypothetical protein